MASLGKQMTVSEPVRAGLAAIPSIALILVAFYSGLAIWSDTCGPNAIACGLLQALYAGIIAGLIAPVLMLKMLRVRRAGSVAFVSTVVTLLGIFATASIGLEWNAPGTVKVVTVTLWTMLVFTATSYVTMPKRQTKPNLKPKRQSPKD